MRLSDKIALITGGSSGIGKAISQRFIKEGAKVIVFDLIRQDYDAEFYKADIRNEDEIKKAFSNIERLDILVNNAGVYLRKSIEDTTGKELDDVIAINLKGTFLMCKYALPLITKSKGNIINIASAIGIAPEPLSTAYCSAKAGVIMLTKCIAQEYAPQGIRANVILPGPIDTPLLRKTFCSEKEMQEYGKSIPLGRIGNADEVANVALFLASDEAAYVTGGIYSVDGGESSSSMYSK